MGLGIAEELLDMAADAPLKTDTAFLDDAAPIAAAS